MEPADVDCIGVLNFQEIPKSSTKDLLTGELKDAALSDMNTTGDAFWAKNAIRHFLTLSADKLLTANAVKNRLNPSIHVKIAVLF